MKKCVFCNDQNIWINDKLAFAIFDKYPVTELHSLIIPKRHVKTFFELSQSEKIACISSLDKIKTKLLKKDKSISGFNVGFNAGKDSGQTIMHCHIHVIPRRKGDIKDPEGGIRNIIPGKGLYQS